MGFTTKRSFSSSSSRSMLAVALALAMVVLLAAEIQTVNSLTASAECKEQRRLGINACKPVISGMQPSAACCYRIRVTPIECVCPVVTPALAALVKDINKAIRIVENCGRRVPRHFKCGSITTP